jgi:hypothetical protein
MAPLGCEERNRERDERAARPVRDIPPENQLNQRTAPGFEEPKGQQTCGGTTAAQCGPLQFCQFPMGVCGEGNATGTCIDKPAACSEVHEPVCGCDNKTYGNECKAWTAGINVRSRGECKNTGEQPKPQEKPAPPDEG